MTVRRLLRPLKPLHVAFQSRVRRRRIRKLVAQLTDAARTPETIVPLVGRLRKAWGNDSYAADLGFLDEMVQRTVQSRGPFLDCGSGISTVILGALSVDKRDRVWSLEQDEQWYRATRDCLNDVGLTGVQLLHAPLTLCGDAAWYSFEHPAFPRHFPLIVCDGPAVRRSQWPEAVFQSWRVGVVAELRSRGVSFDTIILDDAQDKRCGALIEAWRNAGLRVETVDTPGGSHVVAHNVRPSLPEDRTG